MRCFEIDFGQYPPEWKDGGTVRYEFLKILRKKSTLIVRAVSLILTGFLFGLPMMQYQIYNQDGVIKKRGKEDRV